MRKKIRSVDAPAAADRYSGGRIHFSKHSFIVCVIPLNMEVVVDLCAPADFLGALLLGMGGYIFRHFR